MERLNLTCESEKAPQEVAFTVRPERSELVDRYGAGMRRGRGLWAKE